jgi:hypothetical protein
MKTTEQTFREARSACEQLAAALASAGITLPSLGLDPVTAAGTGSRPRPLVELGCCNAETARALAEAVRAGALR